MESEARLARFKEQNFDRLPDTTQEVLKQLACLGNSAEVAILTMVHGESKEEVHAALTEAVRTGLITVAAAGNTLTLTVPLSVNAQMPVKSSFFKTTANGTATGIATAHTTLSLGPDWRIHSQTPSGVFKGS